MCYSIQNIDKEILCMVQDDALVLYLREIHFDSLVPISVERAASGKNTSIVICEPSTTSSSSKTHIFMDETYKIEENDVPNAT